MAVAEVKKQTKLPHSITIDGIAIPWKIKSQEVENEDALKYLIAKYIKKTNSYVLTTEINHQALINDLFLKEHFIAPLGEVIDKECKNKDIELYNYSSGVYKPFGIHTIKTFCYSKVKSMITGKNYEVIVDYIKTHRRKSNDILNSQNILTLQDCNYNWVTKKVEPHKPEVFNTISIPVKWENPDADVKPFDEFLDKVMLPSEKQAMYEIIGYCLYYKNMSIRELFIFYGSQTACGKTVCANVITKLLGEYNTNSATLTEMVEKQFSSSMIVGKMLNICPEEEQGSLPTSKIKAWTGQDRMNSERKGKDEISTPTTAKFIVLSNHLPSFYTSEESIFTRINVLSFPHSFKDDADDKLTDKLTTPNVLSGILHKSIEAFKKVEKTGKFSNWKPIETRQNMINTVSNSLRAFADMFIERGEFDDVMTKHALHVMYSDSFCEVIGTEAKVIAKITCGKLLPKVLDYVEDGRRDIHEGEKKVGQERIWRYVKWRETDKIIGDMRALLTSMGKELDKHWKPPTNASRWDSPPKKEPESEPEPDITSPKWVDKDDRSQSERNEEFIQALMENPDGLTLGQLVSAIELSSEKLETIIQHFKDNNKVAQDGNKYKLNR